MPSECKFLLYNDLEHYYFDSDNKVEGLVTLKTTRHKHVKYVKIRLKGVSKCRLAETLPDLGEDNCFPHSTLYFKSKEKFLKLETIVREAGVLPAGLYCWPFSFSLDMTCPTSVEGSYGHIRYELSLKICNEAKYKNLFIKPITIIEPNNLNLMRNCRLPQQTASRTTVLCGLFSTTPQFNLKTQFRGYVPGQSLVYTLDLFDRVVQAYTIRFIRRTEYKADEPAESEFGEEAVLYHKFQPAEREPYQTIVDEFDIPCTPPTLQTKYISVQYFLRLAAKVPCCCKSKGELPIYIGTIPLKESLPPRLQIALNRDPENLSIMGPTSYERPEIFGTPFSDTDRDELNRVEDFMPEYPMYIYRGSDFAPYRDERLI